MKTMIIGLSPEYNYPGSFEKWRSNNTYYVSNHGASFICRALLRQFDADYIDDFSDIPALRNKYDVCVLALSTHIHRKRDISYLADVVEKLESGGKVLDIGCGEGHSTNLMAQAYPNSQFTGYEFREDAIQAGCRGWDKFKGRVGRFQRDHRSYLSGREKLFIVQRIAM